MTALMSSASIDLMPATMINTCGTLTNYFEEAAKRDRRDCCSGQEVGGSNPFDAVIDFRKWLSSPHYAQNFVDIHDCDLVAERLARKSH
jgi:hypothetical protein